MYGLLAQRRKQQPGKAFTSKEDFCMKHTPKKSGKKYCPITNLREYKIDTKIKHYITNFIYALGIKHGLGDSPLPIQ